MIQTRRLVKMLVALTEEFASCFAAEKKRKNLVDFSDMEHFALKILVDQTTKEPTETADEFAALFDSCVIYTFRTCVPMFSSEMSMT